MALSPYILLKLMLVKTFVKIVNNAGFNEKGVLKYCYCESNMG